jgi:general secretion pathway protein D
MTSPFQLQWQTSALIMALVALCTLASGCASPDGRKADSLAAQGDWDAAVEAYRDAVKRAPLDRNLQQRLDHAKGEAAVLHYELGQQAMVDHRIGDALFEFKTAVGLQSSRREYQVALGDALRLKQARDELQSAEKLRGIGRLEDAMAAYEHAVQLDPTLAEALTGISKLASQARAAKGLGNTHQPITLRFQNAKLKEVFEILARTSGISVVFDKEVRDDPITVFLKDLSVEDALSLILNTNGLYAQRLGPDTLLIIPNTKPKLAQYQDLMIRTFYLSNAKAKEAVNLLRTIFESKRIYVDEKINALVMREEPAKLQLAERVLQAIDRRDSEVQLDLEVLEVDRTKSMKYGINFAKAAGAGVFPSGSNGPINTAPTQFNYQQLTSLSPTSYLFTIPGSILLDFFRNDTDAKTLAAPKLRVLNNKQATIQVGDKQPILLSTTNVLPGQAATGAIPTTSTVTSIEFKDVGVKLTVEPVVHLSDELTLKLKIEVTRLGDQVTLQASPEIKQFKFGTRSAETVLMLRDDETIVLGGLMQDDARKTRVSVPWIGDLPFIGHLFSTWTEDMVTTEVVLTITPHIVRNLLTPGPEAQAFWSGTETNFSTSPLFAVLPVAHVPSVAMEPIGAAGSPSATLTPPSVGPLLRPSQPDGGVASRRDEQSVLGISPVRSTLTVGKKVLLDLTLAHLKEATESNVTVAYDPQILEFVNVSEGESLSGSAEGGAGLTVGANPGNGSLVINVRHPPIPTGQQILARLSFKAKKVGESPVTVQSAAVRGAGNRVIPMVIEQGAVTVQ